MWAISTCATLVLNVADPFGHASLESKLFLRSSLQIDFLQQTWFCSFCWGDFQADNRGKESAVHACQGSQSVQQMSLHMLTSRPPDSPIVRAQQMSTTRAPNMLLCWQQTACSRCMHMKDASSVHGQDNS